MIGRRCYCLHHHCACGSHCCGLNRCSLGRHSGHQRRLQRGSDGQRNRNNLSSGSGNLGHESGQHCRSGCTFGSYDEGGDRLSQCCSLTDRGGGDHCSGGGRQGRPIGGSEQRLLRSCQIRNAHGSHQFWEPRADIPRRCHIGFHHRSENSHHKEGLQSCLFVFHFILFVKVSFRLPADVKQTFKRLATFFNKYFEPSVR